MKVTYPIINGPAHGEELTEDTVYPDGTILHTRVLSPVVKYPEECAVNLMHPTIDRKYLILSGFAYYAGEVVLVDGTAI